MSGAELGAGTNRRRVLIGSAASLTTAFTPAALHARGGVDRRVETRHGAVVGTREGGIDRFLGIRYGADTAPLRFRPPTPPRRWRDTLPARAFAASAPQRGSRYSPQSEDCLFLNVWTPEARAGARRPVMVYLHGGAYASGSVADPLNDGRHLAARGDVVVVTVNHRLNALGYLQLAAIDPRFADSGNIGQHDILLALMWVRENIANFGGDPARVMLFGQSGGGAKIATLMATPAAAGLFHAAATMSGQQVTASGPQNATRRTRAYLDRLGVTADPAGVERARTMPVDALIDALAADDPILGGSIYFGPVLDMRMLSRHPFWPDAPPQSHAIPMILGNTLDETRGFFGPDHRLIAGLDWANLADRMGPELRVDLDPAWVVAQFRVRYPAMRAEELFFAATTAARSWRGQVEEAEARAAAKSPTWVYRLDFASPVEPWRRAPHTHDIPLVFGTLDAPGSLTGTGAAARRLSDRMIDAFVALARSGAPGRAGLPEWPRYALPERYTMILDVDPRVEADPRGWERELFGRIPYIQPGS